MIHETDLNEAIAECLGKRNPDAQTCIKLAAFYTIKQHMYGHADEEEIQSSREPESSYSFSSGDGTFRYESDTAFGKAIKGMEEDQVMPLIDELVETIRVINPRLYEAFLRKLNSI